MESLISRLMRSEYIITVNKELFCFWLHLVGGFSRLNSAVIMNASPFYHKCGIPLSYVTEF